ncbi:restriction endonuclease [Halovenus sp. HT40]|uniref:restriction endonuclease n=1 Tax=Halovenus sp. HT40 TaxID=3126691 RepID=UPI00300F3EB9
MGTIIDLTDGQDHKILQTTEADGLFGGTYLDGQPLGQYLDGNEQPKYVLRNKKSGVTIEGDDERSLEPDSQFQAFALVTDLRIIFVVGKQGGDDSLTLRLPDIVEVSTESGLRKSSLSIETLTDEVWLFPCSGDPTAVRQYLEEAAQIWANAARLLDDLEEALGVAEQELAADNPDAAREHLDGARETIETAIHRIAEVGPAARTQISDRADELRDWLTDVERELAGADGARAHAGAQSLWQHNEYEAAAASYDQAIEAYQQALDIDGSAPTTESLQSRLRGAAAERELLRVGPIVDADSSRRRAMALADPEDAAGEWERALDLYHDLLGLDWGESDSEFVADRELIREQTSEIADDAISDHYEAGRQWLRSGDKLAVQGRDKQATQVYERAGEQFEHARRLASEVRPDRLDSAENGIAATDARLDGDRPTEAVPTDPIEFDPAETAGEDADSDSDADDSAEATADGMEGLSFHDSGSTATQSHEPTPNTESTPPQFEADGQHSESVLDRIQAQKQTDHTSTASDSTYQGESADSSDPSPTESIDSGALQERIDGVDAAELRALVARLWGAGRWNTSVLDGAGQAVYDVVAVAEGADERLLLWTVAADAGPVDRKLIKQCATTVEDSQNSDTAVVVTTGSITPAARSEAEESTVTIVGPDSLLDRLRDADLAGAVPPVENGESPQT